MLHLVHLDILDQGLGKNVLSMTLLRVKIATNVYNQHLYLYQFINQNSILFPSSFDDSTIFFSSKIVNNKFYKYSLNVTM